MEAKIIVLFVVFFVALVTLVVLLLTLKQKTPGKTVVVIKDKRKRTTNKKEKQKIEEKPQEELVLKPQYASIKLKCSKCRKEFYVQEQKINEDFVCKCGAIADKTAHFKKLLRAEQKAQDKDVELALGMFYLYGVGTEKDDHKAYLFLNLSAKNKNDVAKSLLRTYYNDEIAKICAENIKNISNGKTEAEIIGLNLNLNTPNRPAKTLNALHEQVKNYFDWADFHRINCYDVETLARVGLQQINPHTVLKTVEGGEVVDFDQLDKKLAITYLDLAANNGRVDLFAELGFMLVGGGEKQADRAKEYFKKGISFGDKRAIELYNTFFGEKTETTKPEEKAKAKPAEKTEEKAKEKTEQKKLEAPEKQLLIESKDEVVVFKAEAEKVEDKKEVKVEVKAKEVKTEKKPEKTKTAEKKAEAKPYKENKTEEPKKASRKIKLEEEKTSVEEKSEKTDKKDAE